MSEFAIKALIVTVVIVLSGCDNEYVKSCKAAADRKEISCIDSSPGSIAGMCTGMKKTDYYICEQRHG